MSVTTLPALASLPAQNARIAIAGRGDLPETPNISSLDLSVVTVESLVAQDISAYSHRVSRRASARENGAAVARR